MVCANCQQTGCLLCGLGQNLVRAHTRVSYGACRDMSLARDPICCSTPLPPPPPLWLSALNLLIQGFAWILMGHHSSSNFPFRHFLDGPSQYILVGNARADLLCTNYFRIQKEKLTVFFLIFYSNIYQSNFSITNFIGKHQQKHVVSIY